MTSTYPKDEFDLAGDDMPVGMHRPEPSRWRNVFPFLVILVAAPLFAWALTQLLTSNVDGSQSGSSVTVAGQSEAAQSEAAVPEVPQSEPAQEQQSEAVEAPEAPQSEPVSQAAQINYNAPIEVLNGTGTQGLAAQKVAALNEAGFPGASAANAIGWQTEISTIYYSDPQVEVTAKEIGRLLGVETFSLDPNLDSNADIVVVLK